MTHSTHFMFGYIALSYNDKESFIKTMRQKTHCCHTMGYLFQITTWDLLYAPSHRAVHIMVVTPLWSNGWNMKWPNGSTMRDQSDDPLHGTWNGPLDPPWVINLMIHWMEHEMAHWIHHEWSIWWYIGWNMKWPIGSTIASWADALPWC